MSVAFQVPLNVTVMAMTEHSKRMQTYPEPQNGGAVPRALPPELLKLTYQNRLRTIGRHLDMHGQRSIFIVEVDGGFIVRCVSRADRDIDLLEFTDESYPDRMIAATEARGQGERVERNSPVAPTGYEDLLRAIGRIVDEHRAGAVVIAEAGDSLVVCGDIRDGEAPATFDMTFDEPDITAVLDESFRLRFRDQQ